MMLKVPAELPGAEQQRVRDGAGVAAGAALRPQRGPAPQADLLAHLPALALAHH